MAYGDEEMGDDILLGLGIEGLSEEELDGLYDYVQLNDYDLDGLVGLGGRKGRVAQAAKRVKGAARGSTQRAKSIVRGARKAKRNKLSYGSGGVYCPPAPGCAVMKRVNQIMYDTESLATTQAAGDVNYFSTPLGQSSSISGNAITKTQYHTNMTASKSLPSPQSYDIIGVSFQLESNNGTTGATIRALGNLRANCSVVIYINNNAELTIPLCVMPMFAPLQAAYDGTSGSLNTSWVWGSAEMYNMRVLGNNGMWNPIHINPLENFWLQLKIGNALSLGATFDLKFNFHGILSKAVS